MSANSTVVNSSGDVDGVALARHCRALVLASFPAHKTSCIETSALFVRAAELLGAPATRLVCQVQAFSPKLAEQIRTNTLDKASIGQPGIWSLAVGLPSHCGESVGSIDETANRFVGHVVCVADDHLIDPSVDQLSRPEWDMPLPGPVFFKLDDQMKANQVAVTRTAHGVVLKYVFYPDVPVPTAKSGKIIERLARGVAREFGHRK